MDEKLFTEKYKYTGPTILVGSNDQYELQGGMFVDAEVNINIATITALHKGDSMFAIATPVDVAAKYLEPIKPEPIDFKSDVDVGHFFGNLWKDMAKMQGAPSREALEKIRKFAHNREDNIEVGGQHYQTAIQPWDFIYANHIPFDEGCAIKYLCRHKNKNGAEDIKKAISYCKHILKTQYGIDYDKTD